MQNFNYFTYNTMIGMMNRFCSINTDSYNSFFKTKSKNHIVYGDVTLNSLNYINKDIEKYNPNKISLMYCDNDLKQDILNDDTIINNYNISGSYNEEQIISVIDRTYFEPNENNIFMQGKKFKELRGPINKYKDIIKVKNIYQSKDDVIEMIEKWRYMDNGGMKYKWQERAAVDKALVERYCKEQLGEHYIGFAFYIYNDELKMDECIAYAITMRRPSYLIEEYINRNESIYRPVFNYMNRKVLCKKEYRNLTEYIDWYVFNTLYKQCKINGYIEYDDKNAKIYINWGCSSGGVKWYKEHKWPLYNKQIKYFYNLKKKII